MSLEQARFNCSIEDSDSDEALIQSFARPRVLRGSHRCRLMSCQWRMVFDRFPLREAWLTLPRWPLVSIDELEYVASDGTLSTISSDDIVLRKDFTAADGSRWSTGQLASHAQHTRRRAYHIHAGYQAPEDVPSTWQRALLMLVTWWFEQREAGVLGTIANTAPIGVDDLLASAAAVDDLTISTWGTHASHSPSRKDASQDCRARESGKRWTISAVPNATTLGT